MSEGGNVLLCFGLGYTAKALVRRLDENFPLVRGTMRKALTGEGGMTHAGLERFTFTRATPLPERAFCGITHVLVSIPPDEAGDVTLDMHARALREAKGLRWIGYLSTTAVYGDSGGAFVDEDAALKPLVARAARRVEAEKRWRALSPAVHIFRLSGIYGPGRNALEAVCAGRARRIIKAGQVFSRIHVEDAASALLASIARPRGGAVYNLCDDEPAPPQDVVTYACALMGVAPPVPVAYEQARLSEMARSFYEGGVRRVSNRRIKEALGVRLRYPHYRAGLAALALGMEGGEGRRQADCPKPQG